MGVKGYHISSEKYPIFRVRGVPERLLNVPAGMFRNCMHLRTGSRVVRSDLHHHARKKMLTNKIGHHDEYHHDEYSGE